MRAMGRSFVGVAMAFVVVCAYAAEARAGETEAAAEALFLEAKKLAAQKKYGEACPKFAESNRLDRGAGTLIHLGDCYEKNKQTASAWATYKEAASAAQALGRKDWEKLASQRANALEPKLARLTINVDKSNDTVEVSRDGTTVAKASFGVPIPVDVGSHSVEATAAGHKPFKTSVTVAKDGETVEVSVPKLEAEAVAEAAPAPKPAETTAPPPKPESDGSGQRTVGFIVGGAIIVDQVFSYPGVGKMLLDATNAKDYALMLTMIFGVASRVVLGLRWGVARGRRRRSRARRPE